MKRIILLFSALVLVSTGLFSQKTQLLHFYVEAGNFTRINTPVSVDLEGVVKSDTLGFHLIEKVKGTMVEKQFQIEPAYVPRLWWILDGTT